MSMMKKIDIDGKAVVLRHLPPFRVFTGLSFRGTFTRICGLWKRVSGMVIQRNLPWICFPLRCLKILRM